MAENSGISFGYEFEVKLIAALITDSEFVVQIVENLKPEYFNSGASKWIISTVIDHYKKYKVGPSSVVFKTQLEKFTPEEELRKTEILTYLKDASQYFKSTDLPFIKDETINFCRNSAIKNAIYSSVDLLQENKYDDIKKLLDEALKVGLNRNLGHNYKEDFEQRYMMSRDPIATLWGPIDDIMQGGLSKGELGIVVAPSGAGKSWVLVNIALAALRQGKTVLHYTLELNEEYTGLRYDSVLSGYANSSVTLYKDEIKELVEKLPGELIIEYYSSKTGSVLTLEAHVERATKLGFKPDMIIVDYPDLLKGTGRELRHELENIYTDLRGLAGELQIPIWGASQSNRSAMDEEVIRGDKVSESYNKVMIADFIMSLSRRDADVLAKVARFYIIKNRFGRDKFTLPAKFDAGVGIIDITYASTKTGAEIRKNQDEGEREYIRQMQRKYSDFFEQKYPEMQNK